MTTVVLWPLCGHSYVLLRKDENINYEKSVVRNHFRASVSWAGTVCHEMVLPQGVHSTLLAILDPTAGQSIQEQVYHCDRTYILQGFEFHEFWRGPMGKDTCFGRRLKVCFYWAGVSGVPGCPAEFLLRKLLSHCCVFLVIAMCQGF